MKHTMGNSPRCSECKWFIEEEDVRTKNVVGYCINKEYLRHGVNGKILENPKERKSVHRRDCCRYWIDAESGHTKFEVLTGYREPYDGTKINWDDECEQQKLDWSEEDE